jgi:hypothetical protein
MLTIDRIASSPCSSHAAVNQASNKIAESWKMSVSMPLIQKRAGNNVEHGDHTRVKE